MPQITLYGSNGQNTVEIPAPTGKGKPVERPAPPPPVTPEDTGHHRNATFKGLRDLINKFRHAGICESDYWDSVKSELGITRQKEIADPTWAVLAAEVNAARRDEQAFARLVERVQAFRRQNPPDETPAEDALPLLFAEPDEPLSTCFVLQKDRQTGKESLVFFGELTDDVRKRCQEEANETRCILRLYHDGQKPEVFYPETNGSVPF